MKDTLRLSAGHAVAQAPRTWIVADPSWLETLSRDGLELVPDLVVQPLSPEAMPTREDLQDAELLVLEVDAARLDTMERLADVRRTRPDLAIIAAVSGADMQVLRTLLRHGVSDVVTLPFDTDELTDEIFNIGARLAESTEVPLSPASVFVGALGRTGASAIMLHLADALVSQADHAVRCCLIDLDLQSGQLAARAGVDNSRSILSLLEADERLDQDMIRNVAVKNRDGLYIIASPDEILPVEQVDTDQLMRIVALARAEFDLVLIDLPPVWTTWSLSLAAECEDIVFVTRQSLDHLRQTRRCFDLFREVGIPLDRVRVVVNRASKGMFRRISLQDVSDTIGYDVFAAVREDGGELSQAIDEGRMVTSISRKNGFALDVADLAAAWRETKGLLAR